MYLKMFLLVKCSYIKAQTKPDHGRPGEHQWNLYEEFAGVLSHWGKSQDTSLQTQSH